jgi:putative ABC transport system permease protein
VSALLRKSITDLTRRKARTFFTVATLALAVASFGFFAIPSLIDGSMQEEVRAGRLADVAVSMRPLTLNAEQLAELEALPNVAAVEPRSSMETRVLVGERRAPARLIGVRDFARQQVDLVRVDSGTLPAEGGVATEVQNANVGLLDVGAGDTVTLVGAAGGQASPGKGRVELPVSGQARNTTGGEDVQDDDVIVLYMTADTVAKLNGGAGYNRLALLLRDSSPAAAAKTVEAVRGYLRSVPGFSGFSSLPEIRAPGDWSGKAETAQFAQLLGVITVLALLSSLVLISNTMTTLVSEQTGEIGVMRALGARRRQIAFVYTKTAALLGVLGAIAGAVLGIVIANLLAGYFGQTFWAVDVGFGVDPTVLLVSLAVGILAPPLAALPAVRRGTRIDLREALESTGSAVGGQDAADRMLRRFRFAPRTVQIGLRGVGRRKRRSIATAVIVALAVSNLLATLGLAASVTQTTRAEWADHFEDLRVWTSGSKLFDDRAAETIRTTPGVAAAQPALVTDVELAGEEAFVWGVPHEPLFRYRLSDGRWFTAAEEQGRERVAVIERNLALTIGTEVGDQITLSTAGGAAPLRIVGIAKNQQENGTVLFVPLTTVRSVLGAPSGTSTYWIKTTTVDHTLIDRTMTALEDRLTALGYDVGGEITYVEERDNVAENRTITTSIAVLGFIIVAISMVGLANAITMSVLERTREIGVLRCIGARARDVRRIFLTEGVAVAVAGCLLGIPLGYLLEVGLVWLVKQIVNVEFPVVFPPWNIVIALLGTVLLAALIALVPIRRATRLRPGDALRYA